MISYYRSVSSRGEEGGGVVSQAPNLCFTLRTHRLIPQPPRDPNMIHKNEFSHQLLDWYYPCLPFSTGGEILELSTIAEPSIKQAMADAGEAISSDLDLDVDLVPEVCICM